MAEKQDWAKLSKNELLEILQRQEKLLAHKKLLESLPDKGENLIETVKQLRLELMTENMDNFEDVIVKLKRLTLSQPVRWLVKNVLDSDDNNGLRSPRNDLHKPMQKTKHISVRESCKLLEEREKRQKDLQAEHAAMELREQSSQISGESSQRPHEVDGDTEME